MGLLPKLAGDDQSIDLERFPPDCFIASLVQLSMVVAAERHREFIADFDAERPRLCKAEMMWVAWVTEKVSWVPNERSSPASCYRAPAKIPPKDRLALVAE